MMGECKYCGKPAGLFRKKHNECEEKSLSAWKKMMAIASEVVVGTHDPNGLEDKMLDLAKRNYLPESKVKESFICGWEKATNNYLAEDIINEDKERKLIDFIKRFSLTQGDVDRGGAYSKLIKTTVANNILKGKESDWINLNNYSRSAIIDGWKLAVDHFLEDGELSEEEETKLVRYKEKYVLSQDELDNEGSYSKLVKAAVIRDVLNGIFPTRVKIEGAFPFNFQKSERVVWVFKDVQYYEDKVRRQYVGGSQGVSFRIAKGVYYRVGAFKGEAIETTHRIHVDTGMLAITDKHIYFGGSNKSLRVRHDKIVSHTPFSDGVGIHKDGVTAKPQIFITGDGWFTYNLLSNISNLE